MKTIIELGSGRMIINHGNHKGIPCVFIEKAEHPGPIGSDANAELKKDQLTEGGVCITFSSEDAAQVLIDEIRGLFQQS